MPNANQKAKAGIIATRRLLKSERMAGFKATSSALDAIYGNLSTTQNGIGRSQTVANRKTMAALSRIAGKTDRATGRLVRGGEAQASRSYGSVVGAAVDRQSGAVEAHRAAAESTIAGEVAAGRVGVKGATNVLAITKAGAKAAAAGAAGQLADALQYRAKNDAQIIAGMQQARMEANLQFQTWKRQQDYLAKQEQKDSTGSLGGVRTVADTAGDAAVWFREWLGDPDNAGKNATEAIKAYAESHYVDPAAQNLLGMIANKVVASVDDEGHTLPGYSRADETKDLMHAISSLYPNFGKVRDTVAKVISSRWDAYDAEQAAKDAEDAANEKLGRQTPGESNKDVVGGEGTDKYVRTDVQGGTGTDKFQPSADQLVSKSGRAIHYVYGQPVYDDTGLSVPLEDRP